MKTRFIIFLLICLFIPSYSIAQTPEYKEKQKQGKLYFSEGNNKNNEQNYPEALKNYFEALKIYKEIQHKGAIADAYHNIGITYNRIHNYSEALNYYCLALEIRQKTQSKNIASSFNSIGTIYLSLGNYDEALKNFLLSLELSKKEGNNLRIANSLSNIGIIYSHQGNYEYALNNYLASLDIVTVLKDTERISANYINIGETYIKLGQTEQASDFLNNALKLSLKAGIKDHIQDCYRDISVIDSIKNNWSEAYKNFKLYALYKDSIDNEETGEKIAQLTLQNEYEIKEEKQRAEQAQQNAIAAANRKRQNLILGFISLVLILVIVFAIFAVRSLRITKKQKSIIEERKNEVLRQKEMLAQKNKEVTDSINYAKRIQRALLASDKVLNENLNNTGSETPSYFIFFQPKDIVSGDFYWAASLKNGNFALVTADSTGHGVPGAIMSMLNIACLNEAVNGKQLSEPNDILDYTRAKIIENLTNDGSTEGGKDGMDCSLIVFDTSSGKLKYAAANNPVWIVRKQQLIELQPDKMPVGKHERDKVPFALNTIELQKGDVIYTLTDGMPDQFGGSKDKKYMSKQLKELFKAISELPMEIQKQKINEEFNAWKGKAEQVDDVTIIGIRI